MQHCKFKKVTKKREKKEKKTAFSVAIYIDVRKYGVGRVCGGSAAGLQLRVRFVPAALLRCWLC
jgi:hypothetical protein